MSPLLLLFTLFTVNVCKHYLVELYDDQKKAAGDYVNNFNSSADEDFIPKCEHLNPYDRYPKVNRMKRAVSGVEYIPRRSGPRPYGGWCYGNKNQPKECGRQCIKQHEPCGGNCGGDQCLAKSGTKCLEMYTDGDRFKPQLLKRCNGYCVPAHEKCNGECGEDQCFEETSRRCMDPNKDRTEEEKRLGVWKWKHCKDKCIRVEERCEDSCGDSRKFCWDANSRQCKSYQERDKPWSGVLLRMNCDCVCIPYGAKCNNRCGRATCEENGQCLDVLQFNEENKRIRDTCEGKCRPWGQKCNFG